MSIFSVGGAIIGGAVIGAGASIYGAGKQAKAIGKGADAAAQAQMESTRMQVDEIRRQFDYQSQVLYPRLQQQYAAAGAFGDLLGIGANNQPGTDNYNPTASTPIYDSSGQVVGGSGDYGVARPGGPGGPVPMGGTSNRAQGQGSWRRESAGPGLAGTVTDVVNRARGTGRIFDNEGREIDQYQSGLVPPAMQAEFEASGMTPFDFAASRGLIPDDYRGGASTGEFEVQPAGLPVPTIPRGATPFQRGSRGQFVDPNVDPLRLSEAEQLSQQVGSTLLAPTQFEDDVYRNWIGENMAAAATPEESNLMRRAQDVTVTGAIDDRMIGDAIGQRRLFDESGAPSDRMAFAEANQIFGPSFEEGPGYNFMVEEMQREVDRKNSAGGNYGGRALMEAQRRAQGLAAGEYYNWAEGRGRDLSRMERAFDEDYQRQAADYQRLDAADIADIDRLDRANIMDIGRGDEAMSEFERQRLIDVGRGDTAMQNYLGRRQGDVTRMDSAIRERDRLRGVDLAREDTAYQNYLANVRAMAGFGDVSGQVVNASQGAATGIANAYGQQGSTLANVYGQEGRGLANVYGQGVANVNNAITSGLQGWNTYNYLQNQPAAVAPPPQVDPASVGMSDRRLKTNIRKVGEVADLNIYEWDWVGEDLGPTRGFMADEVLLALPEAVGVWQGYQTVNYDMLGGRPNG